MTIANGLQTHPVNVWRPLGGGGGHYDIIVLDMGVVTNLKHLHLSWAARAWRLYWESRRGRNESCRIVLKGTSIYGRRVLDVSAGGSLSS